MKFSNIVQFKPKSGEFENVIAILSEPMPFEGLIQNFIVKTSGDTCCAVGVFAALVAHLAANPGLQDHDIVDLGCGNREEIPVNDDEIGPLARFQAAKPVFLVCGIRGGQRERMQSFLTRQAFPGIPATLGKSCTTLTRNRCIKTIHRIG